VAGADVPNALRRHAYALTSIQPGSGSDDLAPLRQLVAGARVVGLGEAAHDGGGDPRVPHVRRRVRPTRRDTSTAT
jgi:erythromycin esterase-like protein